MLDTKLHISQASELFSTRFDLSFPYFLCVKFESKLVLEMLEEEQ